MFTGIHHEVGMICQRNKWSGARDPSTEQFFNENNVISGIFGLKFQL